MPLAFRLALTPELRLWAEAGRTPVIWWRDDDARAPSEALDRLLALSNRHRAPLTLAAIASPDLASLVRRLESEPGVEIAVHGFQHVNRQPEGRGFGEVVEGDSVDWVSDQLRSTVAAFHQAGAAPTLFTPPWNNLTPQLLAALPGSALTAVSGFDRVSGTDGGVARLDAHLDVLRWKGGGRFRGTWKFLSRMRRLMAERRLAGRWDEPMGLLTHHLDHDEATWRFLERFLATFPVVPRRQLTGEATIQAAALSA